MPPQERKRRWRRIVLVLGIALVLLVGAAAAFVVTQEEGDVSNPDVEFRDGAVPPRPSRRGGARRARQEEDRSRRPLHLGPLRLHARPPPLPAAEEPAAAAVPRDLAVPGQRAARVPAGDRRQAPVPAQRQRRPVRDRQAHRQGALEAQARRARRRVPRLRRRHGLRRAAAAPLQRARAARRPRRRARRQDRQDPLEHGSSRAAASPRRWSPTAGSTSARRTARSTRWTPTTATCAGASGRAARSRAGSRSPTASSTSATTAAASTRSAQSNGGQVWRASHAAAARFGLGAGNFYSTPAVAYGRVYIGNTDGRVYSFSAARGKLAWSKSTGGYVYASPAVAQVPGRPPARLRRLLQRPLLRARRAQRRRSAGRAAATAGSPAARRVIGDIVYYADLGNKRTIGLDARTGRKVFEHERGSYNPVVSDGETIYLTGYHAMYALAAAHRRPTSASGARRRRPRVAPARQRPPASARKRARAAHRGKPARDPPLRPSAASSARPGAPPRGDPRASASSGRKQAHRGRQGRISRSYRNCVKERARSGAASGARARRPRRARALTSPTEYWP